MDLIIKGPVSAALLMLAAHEIGYLSTYETITIAVAEKTTIYEQGNPDPLEGYQPINWQIHTTDETFRVSPDWRRGEFAAAERYHALRPGQVYRVTVAGWSLPFINWYRNIVRIED